MGSDALVVQDMTVSNQSANFSRTVFLSRGHVTGGQQTPNFQIVVGKERRCIRIHSQSRDDKSIDIEVSCPNLHSGARVIASYRR